MVFTCVNLIHGFILTKEDLLALMTDEQKSDDDIFTFSDELAEILEIKEKYLFRYPCCSELGKERFIVGECVQVYKRSNHYCSECAQKRATRGFWKCCTGCLNRMDNGTSLDVEKILNTVVEASPTENVGKHPRKIQRYRNELKPSAEIKDYYMLDDCLSCT